MPSYPLTFPAGLAPAKDEIVDMTSTVSYRVPFTGQLFSQDLLGTWFERTLTMPLLGRAQAQELSAFLSRLYGTTGSFTCGFFLGKTPLGNYIGGSPVVGAVSGDFKTLTIDGGPVSRSQYIKAGDYFQIGSRTYRALETVNTDGAGSCSLDIFPHGNLITVSSPVIFSNPQATWKLARPQAGFSIEVDRLYRFKLELIEAL